MATEMDADGGLKGKALLPSEKMAEKIVRPILTYADEAHHSAADTYQRIMNYFTPNKIKCERIPP